MLQTIQGRKVYVVDLKSKPQLPITGVGEEAPYAEALTVAIENNQLEFPGKYGIEVTHEPTKTIYNLFHIVE